MALRAGYDMYSDFLTSQNVAMDTGAPCNLSYNTAVNPGRYHVGMDPYFGQQLFPFDPPVAGTAAAKNAIFQGGPSSIERFNPDFTSARIHQYNVNFQWEPWKTYTWTAAYVGSHGTHLLTVMDANHPVFIPNASTPDNAQSRRPDQNFQSIAERCSCDNSRYDALQIGLNKRFADGLSLVGNYTYGSATGDGGSVPNELSIISNFRDLANRRLDYGPLGVDHRHILAVSYSYELPFFKNSKRLVKTLLGEWTWGGILHAQSGDPLTIVSTGNFNDSSANSFANYSGGNIYGDHSIRAGQADHCLSAAAFCPANANAVNGSCVVDPAVGVSKLGLGNTTTGFARGPGGFLNDMSLSKNFRVSERAGGLEFRAAAFNVFNHTVLADPITSISSANFGQISGAAAPGRYSCPCDIGSNQELNRLAARSKSVAASLLIPGSKHAQTLFNRSISYDGHFSLGPDSDGAPAGARSHAAAAQRSLAEG